MRNSIALFCCATALALVALPSGAEAATDSSPSSSTSSSPRPFPEMTKDDCANLASKKNSYTASEYQGRTDYCKSMGASGSTSNDAPPDTSSSGSSASSGSHSSSSSY